MNKSIPLFHRFSKPILANETIVKLTQKSHYHTSVDNYSSYYTLVLIKNKCLVVTRRMKDRDLYVIGYVDNLYMYKVTSEFLNPFATFFAVTITLYRKQYTIKFFDRWPEFVSMPYKYIDIDSTNYAQILSQLPYQNVSLDVPASS